MKVLIDIRVKNLNRPDNNFKTAKCDKIIMPKQIDTKYGNTDEVFPDFGIDDRFFGGNISKIVSLKNKPYYLVIDRFNNTLGIIHRFKDLDKYNKIELQDLCTMQRIKFLDKDSKETLLEKLTILEDK